MSKIEIGSLCPENAQRDAVHQAIAPVRATCNMKPGTHCGVNGNSDNPIGVVDPFLKEDVQEGQTFWLFMYPNSIMQLRHEWHHPDFSSNYNNPCITGSASPTEKEKRPDVPTSMKWLKSYARNYLELQDQWRAEDECTAMGCDEMSNSYEEFMSDALDNQIIYRKETVILTGPEGIVDREDLRYHLQIVLGKDIDFNWTGWKFGYEHSLCDTIYGKGYGA